MRCNHPVPKGSCPDCDVVYTGPDVDGIKKDAWVRASREFPNVDINKLYYDPVVQLMLTHSIEVAAKEAKK